MVEDRPVITIRPNGTHLTRQQLPNFEGISAIIADSTKLCMHLVVIPPNVPHQPVNLSEIEEVIAVVARNDPNEQESVVVIETPASWS
jgi:uncharacterized RmlC-like cupin family protein